MGYQLYAFVAKRGTFDHYKTLDPHITVAPLNQGFDMMLNDWHLTDFTLKVATLKEPAGFEGTDLCKEHLEMTEGISRITPLAYVYIHFHGGSGEQHSVVWENGKIALKPANNGWFHQVPDSNGPANVALRAIGVQAGDTDDEFSAIGFKRHRDMIKWFLEYTPFDEYNDYFPPSYGA